MRTRDARIDAASPTSRAGLALAIMLGAQLMIILDATVVNIALPHIQASLHFSSTSLSWVMNAYTLTFGGLLLLGGRAGDILGRRRVFLAGIGLFTLSSLVGGLSTSAGMLLAARAVQGAGGALAAPAVLALIVSGFREGRERTRALGIYMGVITGGSSLGLVLGGVITEWLSWRWVLFINVPIGIAVLAIAPLFVAETPRQAGRFDLAGAVTSTAGVASLVYGFVCAAADGWGDHLTLAAFGAAAVLLAGFLVIESRVHQPITPLRLFADASRSGSFAARLLLLAGMFGVFFFLTQFLQKVMGFSPLRAGVAFLPLTAALFGMSRTAPRLMPRLGAKPLMIIGMLPAIVSLAWLSRVSPATGYWSGVFGPMMLLGIGMGLVFVPLTTASLAGVAPADSGAASSMVNVMQQVGGALGLAVLVAVFGTASRNAQQHPLPGLTAAAQAQHVLAHGMAAAFGLAAIFNVASLMVIVALIRARKLAPQRAEAREEEPAIASR
ncbi:MAG TPA: MFS transporter [Streptosporangiaceae bacterium]|nr:MFS transporter [Streptosporangiaceae bacterium]